MRASSKRVSGINHMRNEMICIGIEIQKWQAVAENKAEA